MKNNSSQQFHKIFFVFTALQKKTQAVALTSLFLETLCLQEALLSLSSLHDESQPAPGVDKKKKNNTKMLCLTGDIIV